jgi:hypothetical protein
MSERNEHGSGWSDPAHWRLGVFYCDPADHRGVVPKRGGHRFGQTLNLAHRARVGGAPRAADPRTAGGSLRLVGTCQTSGWPNKRMQLTVASILGNAGWGPNGQVAAADARSVRQTAC